MSLKKYQNIKSFKDAREQGFTIVELLIVIIVIAILAALVISAYSGVQESAKNSARQAAAQSTKTAVIAYAGDATNTTGKDWPTTLAEITGQTTVKVDPSLTLTGGATQPSSATDAVTLANCGSGAGVKIFYWNKVGKTILLGNTVGSCVAMT